VSAKYPPADAGREYELLACCSFAKHFVGEKTVAVVGDGAGRGTRLLTGDAASVIGQPDLSDLPAAGFDVVVAPGFAGRVEDLAREAKRVLKPDGLLVFSAPDGTNSRSGDPAARAAEPGKSLKNHFRVVRSYRLGTVAGAAIFEEEEQETRDSFEGPASDAALAAGSLLAVCSDAGVPEAGDLPYLALDPDRRVFEEIEELSEEVELLRGEIRRMQESEAQAFEDTLTLRLSEVNHFRTRLERTESRLERTEKRLERTEKRLERTEKRLERTEKRLEERERALTNHNEDLKRQLREIQSSRTWRLLGLYRGLATRLGRR
jgi:SAM-dependent methyltransferase